MLQYQVHKIIDTDGVNFLRNYIYIYLNHSKLYINFDYRTLWEMTKKKKGCFWKIKNFKIKKNSGGSV